ncbi:MAG TPA: fluoride efflux transporter CrcB [Longimicrobiales bacterium]|nr:fluoride efflux transporter CrcB [Longimicrobiales bacterium]
MIVLLIALGGAAGALARYGVANWAFNIWGPSFPAGTLIINITGSLVLGVIMQLAETSSVSPELRAALAIGFCGAFTTFSTFSYESLRLMQDGKWLYAAANVLGSVLLGLAAVIAGFQLAGLITKS